MRSRFELKNFLDFDTKNFYGSNHSLFRWNKRDVNSKIEDYLIKNKLIDWNESIVYLKVIERGESGRVTKLEIKFNDPNKSVFLLKYDEI